MQQTDRQIQETDKKVNALTGKWSKFVEGLVVPAAERLFRERGILVDKVSQRVRARENGEGMEIDVLAVDGEHAVLIEVKSTLGIDDVREHIDRLGKFKRFFPEYDDRKVVGAVAGIVIDEGVDRFAYKNGLFVIAQSGDPVQMLNDSKFVPKEW
jgi:predicted AAA+ superfamily ATPase